MNFFHLVRLWDFFSDLTQWTYHAFINQYTNTYILKLCQSHHEEKPIIFASTYLLMSSSQKQEEQIPEVE